MNSAEIIHTKNGVIAVLNNSNVFAPAVLDEAYEWVLVKYFLLKFAHAFLLNIGMTTTITTYLYNQIVDVVTNDTRVSNTMTLYYAPYVRVYRGIDQAVRMRFKNRDQKAVSILDKTLTFILTDPENHTTLLSKTLDPIDAPKGLAELVLTDNDLVNLSAKHYTYAVKVVDGEGKERPGYVDDMYGANGSLEVVDGVYPTFVESTTENFSSGNTGSKIYLDENINRNAAVHTAAVYFDSSFTGTLTIQASLSPAAPNITDSEFYPIKTVTYTGQTETDLITFTGVYTAIRFVRSGSGISKVLYRP